MKILNLYAGLGGNRKKWSDAFEVTAVEKSPILAETYEENFPQDKVIVDDAHQYLLDHFLEFDFIWSSPPCQSHTRMIRGGKNRTSRYPDLRLYEEILLLKHNFEGLWVVENVVPYYDPLIRPHRIGRHLFWSNFHIPRFNSDDLDLVNFIMTGNTEGSEKMKEWLGIHYEGNIYYEGNHDPCQVLRNCVHPLLGEHVLRSAISYGLQQEIQDQLDQMEFLL